MDHLDSLRRRIKLSLLGALVLENAVVLGSYVALGQTELSATERIAASIVIALVATTAVAWLFTSLVVEPMKRIWQAVLRLSPSEQGNTAPDSKKLLIGQDLVSSLTTQLYQLATVADQAASEAKTKAGDLHQNFVAQYLPLPLFVIDAQDTITFANEQAASYIGIQSHDMIGKNVYMVLDMSFPSPDTLDTWLKSVKVNSATAVNNWERVRLNVRDDHPALLFDLAAYYNRDNPDRNETMLVLFDHTKQYSQDDQAVSFIALSVHELRTPLTLLRGYIEVFEEELSGTMNPELQDFMAKMKAMSDQLTAFVNNILNVARVDDDQLELRLNSEDWASVLKHAIELISLRAKVRGIKLECRIARNLPPVGADRLSVSEVLNNLIDNAIKYSGDSKVIKIDVGLNREGMVQTTIQDFGVGIPRAVVPKLFTKFYRDHRHRAQIGGTGLGLYLSKAIVEAHGGSIWVSSKEGEGSTFGFTLMPYAKLAAQQKQNGESEITRSAQGWIKNHSLYRR